MHKSLKALLLQCQQTQDFSPVLHVAPSRIPDAGLGLFAVIDIPAGMRVIEYKGTFRPASHEEDINKCHTYCFQYSPQLCIDASDEEHANVSRYANDARGNTATHQNNLTWKVDTKNKRVWLWSVKDIQAGDEVCVSYGDDYWGTQELIIYAYDKTNSQLEF